MSITHAATAADTRLWTPQPVPIHLHGTVPAALSGDLTRSMRWFLDHRGTAPLTALPTDLDDDWIIGWLNGLARSDGLEMVRAGDSRNYAEMPHYRIAAGHALAPADVALGRVDEVADAMITLNSPALSDVEVPERLGVSIPNAFDLAMFAAGSPEAAEEWLPVMQAMVVAEVAEIDHLWGHQVQLRLETPAVLLAYYRTPRSDWPLLTGNLVQQVAGILRAAHDAEWVLHLCLGDLAHEPLFVPDELDAAVLFLNALAETLELQGIAMPTVAVPIAHGDAAPSTDPAFYTALRSLRRGVAVIAGLVAENHPAQTRIALGLVVDALAGPVAAVAASCGLGRRSPAAATANMALAAELAREWSPSRIRQP